MYSFRKKKHKHKPSSGSSREEAGFKNFKEEERIDFVDEESTSFFKLHTKAAYEASKVLHEYGGKIRTKEKQPTSKNLEKCREKFKDNLETLIDDVRELSRLLDKKQERSFKRSTSERTPWRKTSGREDCLDCKYLQTKIQTLQDQLSTKDIPDTQNEKEIIDRQRAEINSLREENRRIQQHTKDIPDTQNEKEIIDRQRAEINSLREENRRIQQQFKHKTQDKEDIINQLKKDVNSLLEEKRRMERQFNTIFEENGHQQALLSKQIENLRQQCMVEEAAKNDALKRLSSMASSKLRDNNPNITDLSDQNRPTKIGEKLSELYDNQWTDAFDALEEQHMSEEQAISALLGSLMKAYEECQKLANDSFFEKVQGAIECTRQMSEPTPNRIMMTDQFKQQIKELRKTLAPKAIKEIQKIVRPRIELANNHSKEITTYLSVCVEVCWLMVVQDPPVVLLNKSPVDFDNNRFKDYTKRGRYTEFVVWPALLLHENGPVLSKGVAQGSDHKTSSKIDIYRRETSSEVRGSDSKSIHTTDQNKPDKLYKTQSAGREPKKNKGNDNNMMRSLSASDSRYEGQYNPVSKTTDF